MKKEIFNTTPADYEGIDSDTYGSITPTSTTDSSEVATSIYIAGIEDGFIEFEAKEAQLASHRPGCTGNGSIFTPVVHGMMIGEVLGFFQMRDVEKIAIKGEKNEENNNIILLDNYSILQFSINRRN